MMNETTRNFVNILLEENCKLKIEKNKLIEFCKQLIEENNKLKLKGGKK